MINMQKRSLRLVVLLTTIIISVVVIMIGNSKSETLPPSSVSRKIKPGSEWIAQYIQKKIDRRAKGYAKSDKPDLYVKYLSELKNGGDTSIHYKSGNNYIEFKRAFARVSKLKSAKVILPWREIGPSNIAGRTRSIVIDNEDTTGKTLFAGSVGGGIWKTIDLGTSWVCLTDDWPNLAVSCMVMSESNPQVMYAGTGEGFFNFDKIAGDGIFKSINKGNSWFQLGNTKADLNFRYVNKLIIDPLNPDVVLASTNTGIFKSIDGGLTWQTKFSSANRVQQIVSNPADFQIQLATVNGKEIIKSIDAGESWATVFFSTVGRLEVAISEFNPIWMSCVTEESDVYYSRDGGDNWGKGVPITKTEFLSRQGWYNNEVKFNPQKSDQFFVGGLDVYSVFIGADSAEKGDSVVTTLNALSGGLVYGVVGGTLLGGGLKINSSKLKQFKNVEIRFGVGKTQKAHRFTVNKSAITILSSSSYVYKNYINVPFEVWDIEGNRELMVSFRDQNENGVFDINDNGNELIFIHGNTYNESSPDNTISLNGGIDSQNWFTLYPLLAQGKLLNDFLQTNYTLTIDPYVLKSKVITSQKRTDWTNEGAPNYSHADHHALQIVASGTTVKIFNGSDGGVFYSSNAGTSWKSLNKGYNTSQFYGVARHPSIKKYIGGMQDNGTAMSSVNPSSTSDWSAVLGGDGFDVVWHSRNPNLMLASVYYNSVYKSTDGGVNWVDTSKEILDISDDTAPFYTRISNSPSNPDVVFCVGKSGIWRSTDFGVKWKNIKISQTDWNTNYGHASIAVSQADSKIVWAGTRLDNSNGLMVSLDGGVTFVATAPFAGGSGLISSIYAHPLNPEAVYVTWAISGKPKVAVSLDLGKTWNELSGFGTSATSNNGFPNVAVYSLIEHPENTSTLWVGTEIGLFVSDDNGTTWSYSNNGLPAVCIWNIERVDNELVLATHGRGVWALELNIPSGSDLKPYIKGAGIRPDNKMRIDVDISQTYDSLDFQLNNIVFDRAKNVTKGSFTKLINKELVTTVNSLQFIGYKSGVKYFSNYYLVDKVTYSSPILEYANGFETQQNDFFGNGFSIITYPGFNGFALHSQHPYGENDNFVYSLKYPIIVKPLKKDALMTYRDIAFVEIGENGAAFGSENYFDYAVAEASKDGIHWLNLGNGYDYNSNVLWKNGDKKIDDAPMAKQFVEHSINLQDYFSPNDTLLVRFRLYSDPYSTGWGWVVDNLVIQDVNSGIKNNLGKGLSRVVITPNPVKNELHYLIDGTRMGKGSIDIYNMSGKLELIVLIDKTIPLLENSIDVSILPRGMKLIRISIDNDFQIQKCLFN